MRVGDAPSCDSTRYCAALTIDSLECTFGFGTCSFNCGDVIRGTAVEGFGGAAEYGAPNRARFGGTLISQPVANPQFSGACAG